jgi:predicted RNA-binding protein with PIN domain
MSLLKPEKESGLAAVMATSLPDEQDMTYRKLSDAEIANEYLDKRIDELRVVRAVARSQDHSGEAVPTSDSRHQIQIAGKAAPTTVASQTYSQVSTQGREDLATKRQLDSMVSSIYSSSRLLVNPV